MLKWYIKYCIVSIIIGITVGFLLGDFLITREYILIPGHIVPAIEPVKT